MKTALVVAGGGSRGAFGVGVIEVLREKDVTFDLITGTSTGALIAPLAALDDIDELIRQYTEVKTKDIIRKNWRGLFWKSIYHTRPLERRIRKTLMEGFPSRYKQLMLPEAPRMFVCTVSLQSVAAQYFSQISDDLAKGFGCLEDMVQAILGSASQPIFMPPPELFGEQWVDGGIREIAPLGVAIKAGAERIFVILHSADEGFDKSTEKYTNLLSIGKRTLDLMLDEIILNDVRYAELYNRMIRQCGKFDGKRNVEITLIRPKNPLPSDGLTFKPEIMQQMRVLGQERAQQILSNK